MIAFIKPEYSSGFADWLRSVGHTESEIKDHLFYLRNFGRWYLLTHGEALTPENLSREDLNDYKRYLWGDRPPPKSKRLFIGNRFGDYYSTAMLFYEWAKEQLSPED